MSKVLRGYAIATTNRAACSFFRSAFRNAEGRVELRWSNNPLDAFAYKTEQAAADALEDVASEVPGVKLEVVPLPR